MLNLTLQFSDPRHREVLPRAFVARCLRAATDAPAEYTVRIVDEQEALELNRDYRGRPYATNVLTFDYESHPHVVADLVLCAAVVEQEARAQALSLPAHYAHLLVHGALHAQGWDHEEALEAADMEALEVFILATLGVDDPYGLTRRSQARRPQPAARKSRAASRAK